MDIVTRGVPPTDAERDAVASVLGDDVWRQSHTATGGRVQRARRHLLLPTLHAVNDRVGWLSPEAIDHIAERLDASPAEIHGVATFYGLFATAERPAHQVHVCVDIVCRSRGGPTEATVPRGAHAAPCLGACERGPATLTIDAGDPARRAVTPDATPVAAVPQAGDESLVLLRRVGRVDPTSIDDYLADGGFEALRVARELGPEGVIARVRDSGLTGRGGAGFPTATKWEAVRSQDVWPHHVVCNADESEPGTFKDRALMENDPFALIESILIASLAVGAETAYIYVRGEYPLAEATLRNAISACRERGFVGVGSEIVIVRGAGAYICGEETAIFNSIEGYRGEPRNKPPFPFEAGLFGKPTLVNNVETLMNVPMVVLDGHPTNRRLFCVSGAVDRPGVYEVELTETLGRLIEHAGGMRHGSEFRAALLGGAAGNFVGPDALDLVLGETREVGLSLGSGVVFVHDQHVDLADQLGRIARFFRDESCGQCVPCRVGTVRQEEALHRGDLALLDEIARAMRDASICGLGQTASNAIQSASRMVPGTIRDGGRVGERHG